MQNSILNTPSEFYAYLWLREDGTPYYAGKGRGTRAFETKGHRVRRPRDQSRILIFPRASEAEAFATEKELIVNWGRLDSGTGCLRNRTDGGEGSRGGIISSEQKEKISVALMGKPRVITPDGHLALIRSLRGNRRAVGNKSLRMTGRKHSKETKLKMSISQRHRLADSEET